MLALASALKYFLYLDTVVNVTFSLSSLSPADPKYLPEREFMVCFLGCWAGWEELYEREWKWNDDVYSLRRGFSFSLCVI